MPISGRIGDVSAAKAILDHLLQDAAPIYSTGKSYRMRRSKDEAIRNH